MPTDRAPDGTARRASAPGPLAGILVAVVGWPGPLGSPRGEPGTVAIALAGPDGPVAASEHRFPRGRDWFKRIASWSALEMLRRAVRDEDRLTSEV